MTAKQFEQECRDKICGSIWDESFAVEYQEGITLSIKEMRYIANLLRERQGLKFGIVGPFFEGIDKLEERE